MLPDVSPAFASRGQYWHPLRATWGASTQAITLFGGTRVIARRLWRPFLRECRRGPRYFGGIGRVWATALRQVHTLNRGLVLYSRVRVTYDIYRHTFTLWSWHMAYTVSTRISGCLIFYLLGRLRSAVLLEGRTGALVVRTACRLLDNWTLDIQVVVIY